MNSNTIRNGLLRPSVGKAVVGLSLVLNCQAQAALIMDVGSIALNPGQAGQERVFQVENTGGAPVDTLGIQFNIQIGDGSALLLAPTITQVDILTGTIFATDNSGLSGGMDTVHRWEISTLENGSPPTPSVPTAFSTAATVTFDTTGFGAGSWDVSFTVPSGSTAYIDPASGNPLPMTLIDGTLTIVPEPVNVALGIFGSILAGVQLLRSRRVRGWLTG